MTIGYAGDTLCPGPIEDVYFDKDRNAWILSRYVDVAEAFRSASLHPVGPRGVLKLDKLAANNIERLRMRSETTDALAPAILHVWQAEIRCLAQQILDDLPTSRPVDLVHQYADPICKRLASLATNIAETEAESLLVFAAELSAAAAEPFDKSLATKAKAAEVHLRQHFHSGPLALRESGFVALSQTLPRMLANVWLPLIQQPGEWRRLHFEPALTPRAIEELLRYAGLTRILFRMASQSIQFNGAGIHEGDRLILRVSLANRDPAYFRSPDHLDIARRRINHLSFGIGHHSCVGAPLIRMALVTLTYLLVERYHEAALYQDFQWQGGSGFRFPGALCVLLRS